jgi:hypothetical protein
MRGAGAWYRKQSVSMRFAVAASVELAAGVCTAVFSRVGRCPCR